MLSLQQSMVKMVNTVLFLILAGFFQIFTCKTHHNGSTPNSYRSPIGHSDTGKNIGTFEEIFMISEWLDKVINLVADVSYAFTQHPYDLRTSEDLNSREYDYVVIGGGTAGSVVAARLSEIFENRVLVLEAGDEETGTTQVMYNWSPFLKSKTNEWRLRSEPEKNAAWGRRGNTLQLPVAKMLGGSSSHNGAVWNRGDPMDYDRWAQLGADGWSYAHVFPYFVKIERLVDVGVNVYDKGYHGTRGTVPIRGISAPSIISRSLVEGAREIGWPIGDTNGKDHSVFSYFWLNSYNGTRVSMAEAYLAPASNRPNLSIMTRAFVHRINFDENKRAVSVTFEKDGRVHEVKVRKEVIVSAGSYHSPKILMLSGIGPKNELKRHNIQVIVDSPGIGANLMDHFTAPLSFLIRENSTIIYTRSELLLESVRQFVDNRTGGFDGPSGGIHGHFRTSFALDGRTDIAIGAGYDLSDSLWTSFLAGYIDDLKNEVVAKYILPNSQRDGIQVLFGTGRTSSRGVVRLRNRDPYAKPIIENRIFYDRRDLNSMIKGCKLILKLMQSRAVQEGISAKLFPNTLPGCEQYSLDSDRYCGCVSQTLTSTGYHPSGTCKMGSKDDLMAVVDPQLRVKGVKGLRVIDASVMPEIPNGNTNAPTTMIAEKGSDLIRGRALRPFSPPFKDESEVLQYEYF
ncbi:L-sorbose 1-dehydrogenase-like [Brevipalpus obovatus]|uniref:L-sorbose 1-dehydrogenase-like n=1 Tax=Brevipalpus obovatus TaxID=246614 RepID=UPI003D9EACAA